MTLTWGVTLTQYEKPQISQKSTFHAETAFVAFDSQINTYTYVFMPARSTYGTRISMCNEKCQIWRCNMNEYYKAKCDDS